MYFINSEPPIKANVENPHKNLEQGNLLNFE